MMARDRSPTTGPGAEGGGRARRPTPTEALLSATRRRLVVMTFGLVALLVIGIGAATAVAGLGALGAAVDRALAASVDGAVAGLDGELPQHDGESDDTAPASSDTFILYLDAGGDVIANPSRVRVAGLPDRDAIAALSSGAPRDLRTVTVGGLSVRLLTVPVQLEESGRGYVQGALVLTLHDSQAVGLVTMIAIVAALGLIAAMFVTLIVTDRALGPIRRSMETQRRFIADASHELRTPAALIRANAEVLQRENLVVGDGGPLVGDIVAEADRLGRLVGDLLALAASDARGLQLDLGPLDLPGLARDTARAAAALAAEHDVRVEVRAPESLGVRGDRDRLVQLLVILLDNAIGHSPAGGTVELGVRTRPRGAEITVADEGPGVVAADRERIFQPFTRLPGAERTGTPGSGLGLAIARQIVRAHGGEIRVDDRPGGGAVFVIELPAEGVRPS